MQPRPTTWGIDGDILLYSVGFAAEDDPVGFATHSLRERVYSVMDGCECTQAQVFITGDTNYRMDVASDYKAHREDAKKPTHLPALREFAMTTLDAIVSEGEEADDLLGINAVQNGWGIASLDKDLRGVPGWHYVWQGKDEGVFYVTEEEADRFFYTQLLTGDRTDNIPGLFNRTGRKAMPKIKRGLDELTSPSAMFEYVLQVYLDAVKEARMSSEKDDVLRWLDQQGKCLWIRREVGEVWSCPDV